MARFDIDGDLIRKLADLLAETGLSEIEFAAGDQRVRVASGRAGGGPAVLPAVAAQPQAAEEPAAAPAGAITSPVVGTAYLAPEPGATPFVRAGDRVSEGQTLLIVEAMKVMNPIRAPRGGTVTRIVVQDAQPVEFGEVLMILD